MKQPFASFAGSCAKATRLRNSVEVRQSIFFITLSPPCPCGDRTLGRGFSLSQSDTPHLHHSVDFAGCVSNLDLSTLWRFRLSFLRAGGTCEHEASRQEHNCEGGAVNSHKYLLHRPRGAPSQIVLPENDWSFLPAE